MKNEVSKINYFFIILFLILSFFLIFFYFYNVKYLKLNLPIYLLILLFLFFFLNFISIILFYFNRSNNYYYLEYLKIIIINFLLILFIILIIELFFGNWINADKLNQLNIIKNQKINYNIGNLYDNNDNKIIYTRDKYGFRGNYNNISTIDIVSIGGSTTDQRYISDELTFQSILQKQFAIYDNKYIQIINAGIDGQSTYGHIKNFDYWFNNIDNFTTKYFLFFIGNNDFYINPYHSYDELIKSNTKNYFRIIRFHIKARSALYYFYRIIEGSISANRIGLSHNFKNNDDKNNWTSIPMLNEYDSLMEDRLIEYQKRIKKLIQKTHLFNAKAIFVTQSRRGLYEFRNDILFGKPSLEDYDNSKYNGVDYYYMSRLINNITRKEALRSNSIFINLDEELEFNIEEDFYDTDHHTPSGTEKIGKFLYLNLKNIF